MTLYEFYNTTNQTSPHFEAHDNFVTPIYLPTCAMVQVMPYEDRCNYTQMTPQCLDNVFIFNYIDFLYCTIAARNQLEMGLAIVFLLFVCMIMFVILGSAADGFFCPSLKVLAKMMGLNENVAGVTLLAFGNGAPDLFTAIASLEGESNSIVSNSVGSATFVFLFVGGVIIAYDPFVVHGMSFTRDILFLSLDIVALEVITLKGKYMGLFEAIAYLSLYVFFITVVLTDQWLLKRSKHITPVSAKTSKTSKATTKFSNVQKAERVDDADFEIVSRNASGKVRYFIDVEEAQTAYHKSKFEANENLFDQLANDLRPIDMDEFNQSGNLGKLFLFCQSPIVFFMKILIPVVDYEKDLNGWSKLLNCSQIMTLPAFLVFCIIPDVNVFSMPVWIFTFLITTPITIVLFGSSRTDTPPAFHRYYSIMGAVGSIYVIYGVANETVSVLDAIGITTYRSNSFLGCTLLAYGNSVGDLVSNLAMARQGYSRMAFAACIGGPLFNTILSIGTSFVYNTALDEDLHTEVAPGTMGENGTAFLKIGIIFILLGSVCTNFVLRRGMGYFFIVMYLVFLIFTFCSEMNYVHPFGTDHHLDIRPEENII